MFLGTRLGAFLVCLSIALGCDGNIGDLEPDGPIAPLPTFPPDPTRPEPTSCDTFQPSPVHVYAAKVKNLVVSLPLTNEELMSLQADPAALSAMVDGWIATPEADEKLVDFFSTAFQQEGFAPTALDAQWGGSGATYGFLRDEEGAGQEARQRTRVSDPIRENFETSFARTALEIVREGDSFTNVATTRQFMMTTAMLTAIAFQDDRHLTDGGRPITYRTLLDEIETVVYTRTGPIPPSETLDPAHANFMRFYNDSALAVPPCAGDEIASAGNQSPGAAFFSILGFYGAIGVLGECRSANNLSEGLLVRSDFEDWRLVTIRQPADGETTTRFYDFDNLRTATEFVAHTPRVGFFTTLAFFAVWETNEDNDARVHANQTLITALGQSIDPSQIIIPAFDDALDAAHADPTTACWGCHKTLDPMRQIFRQEYTYLSSQQMNEEVRAVPSAFAWGGVTAEPTTIFEFADVIAGHPQFARGWVQKMCFYANSAACPEGPEFDAVVRSFVDSGHDFRVMFRTLLVSDLVTNAGCIENNSGDNAGISRTRHFCAGLSNRLGVEDTCGTNIVFNAQRIPIRNQNAPLVATIPNDAFSRGDQYPLTVSDVNLFVHGTYERICTNTAKQMVESEEAMFTPSDSEGAINFFTTQLMGFPEADPRHTRGRQILVDHYESARVVEGSDDVAALQSTFVVACLSPSLIGMGL